MATKKEASEEVPHEVKICADRYGDGRKTITGTIDINDVPYIDASGPNLEFVLLDLIDILVQRLIEMGER